MKTQEEKSFLALDPSTPVIIQVLGNDGDPFFRTLNGTLNNVLTRIIEDHCVESRTNGKPVPKTIKAKVTIIEENDPGFDDEGDELTMVRLITPFQYDIRNEITTFKTNCDVPEN